jgi:outer membrane protein assembly factor BamD (BamD/ComL family)
MRRLALLVPLLLLSACAATPRVGPAASSAEGDRLVREADRLHEADRLVVESDRLLREADAQLASGNPAAAIRILEDVVRRFPDPPVRDRALYELGRALILTANGGRDYRQASTQLDRLLREHPTSPHAADARALRIVIASYIARTSELDRLLERLRVIDLEFERPHKP